MLKSANIEIEEICDTENAQEEVGEENKNKEKTFTQPKITTFFNQLISTPQKCALNQNFFGGDFRQKCALFWYALNWMTEV